MENFSIRITKLGRGTNASQSRTSPATLRMVDVAIARAGAVAHAATLGVIEIHSHKLLCE